MAIDVPDDPLLDRLPDPAPFIFWHADAITRLPVGAVALAHTNSYDSQAFRLGERAWGVQFHPEATIHDLGAWAKLTGELTSNEAETITHDAQAEEEEMTACSHRLAMNFASVVRAAGVRESPSLP